ncbi:MAG: putative deacylase [bacterium]|jgi:predicted deacylase
MKHIISVIFLLLSIVASSQDQIESIEEINLDNQAPHQIKKYWLKLFDNGLSQPISIPVIIAKGDDSGPVLGLTAAIHGNELNGIKVIQEVLEQININELKGIIIAVPGLNQVSVTQDRRRFFDDEDLNRNFPGKEKGNRSQQYVWQINDKILSKIDYLIDMHTASFGRVNSLYVRADMDNEKMKQMALLQDADIILKNKGVPSAGDNISATRTMRAEAMLKGIPTITIEYGNPQVYQPEMTVRGVNGIKNVLNWLKMHDFETPESNQAVLCKKSYWIYLDQGGLLEVPVKLNQIVEKDEIIGQLRNPFGEIIKTYKSPERGIVIGKSSNPVNMSGGRIIHLGIIAD